jgi:hypothetical protein
MMLEMWFRTVPDREREVLAMVAASHNNTAIAARVYRTAGIEIFDQPGGCVPPAAMVPVEGGVGDVLVAGSFAAARRISRASRR